ncbi:hypothetical protein BaRGS_00037159, partial [Batillaria attramentaria]
ALSHFLSPSRPDWQLTDSHVGSRHDSWSALLQPVTSEEETLTQSSPCSTSRVFNCFTDSVTSSVVWWILEPPDPSTKLDSYQTSLGGSAGGPVSPAALFKPLALYEPGLVGPGGYLAPPLTAYPTAALVNHFYTLPYHRPDYGLFDRHPALAKGQQDSLAIQLLQHPSSVTKEPRSFSRGPVGELPLGFKPHYKCRLSGGGEPSKPACKTP